MQFKKKINKRLGLDITPLIDVIFLLLIFFMISTTFPDSPGIKVNLPYAQTTTPPKVKKTFSISINAKNKMYIGGALIEKKNLKKVLSQTKNSLKQDTLIIRADGDVKHKFVVFVMDTAKKAGVRKLSIATSKEDLKTAK
ncbi:MAG: biopolymer transporter ExbD [Proteobacteria bacterium]|nr:biopolymer transporter ExbD [Pseudomonadota bacterium]